MSLKFDRSKGKYDVFKKLEKPSSANYKNPFMLDEEEEKLDT